MLSDKVILLAGATGMAAAAAEAFVAAGARVFITARTESSCADLAHRLDELAARPVAAWRAADLREEVAVEGVVAAAVERFGRLDGCFHTAGGSGRRFGDGPLHEIGLEAWEQTFRLNLTTEFLVARESLRAMLRNEPGPGGRGSIVMMSSVSAFRAAPMHFAAHAYQAAKAAIAGLVATTSAYYAPAGIRVNAIAPGLVATPMSTRAQSDPAILAYGALRQPLTGGILEAGDVAGLVTLLLSDRGRAITGQMIDVDGGWSVADASGWPGPALPGDAATGR
ncbi:MAG: SDR family NAD(P)-dependent oxidoreductase [Candidatus Limnocylindria bacterium]